MIIGKKENMATLAITNFSLEKNWLIKQSIIVDSVIAPIVLTVSFSPIRVLILSEKILFEKTDKSVK